MADQQGVQSVLRAFALLEAVAAAGGQGTIVSLAEESGLAVGSAHRLMRTLVGAGYARQLDSREYTLGPGLIRLGTAAQGLIAMWARPYLAAVVERLGETANLAVLDQDSAVYLAQVPSKHSMRMFTEVGRRVLPHCTGVGKALLSQVDDDRVAEILGRTGLPEQTPRTITTVEAYLREMQRIRAAGYALDDGEQELGVRCIAVPLQGGGTRLAMSISGPASRLPTRAIGPAAIVLQETAAALSRELGA